jgi:hypothetical protein
MKSRHLSRSIQANRNPNRHPFVVKVSGREWRACWGYFNQGPGLSLIPRENNDAHLRIRKADASSSPLIDSTSPLQTVASYHRVISLGFAGHMPKGQM